MKKTILATLVLVSSVIAMPLQSNANTMENKAISMPDQTAAEIEQSTVLLNRLDEINALDKSNMNSSEKREMRNEVRSINKQLKDINGGVYLSVGAIIIILLVLILLL